MGELAKDLKFWPGVAAIGLELLGLGLLGLAVLESRGPTCVVSMCDDAHVPSPGLMLAIFALGLAAMLTVVSLWMAAVAGLAWRTTRGFSEALTVGLGLATLAGQWAGAAALGNRQGLTFRSNSRPGCCSSGRTSRSFRAWLLSPLVGGHIER